MKKYKILFLSTPVGPLGSGEGGGVETNLINAATILAKRGYKVAVIAPKGSKTFSPKIKMFEVPGKLQKSAITGKKDFLPTMNSKGVLENMWKVAFEQEGDYDAIVSHSYDWLSYYLSPFFEVPVLHAVALAPTIKYTDKIIKQRYKKFSKQFAFFSKNQAYFFGIKNLKNLQILYGGVVLENFKFNLKPQNRLVWSARISPEKGLLDAFAVADKLNLPLDICGKMQDKKYFNSVLKKFPKVKYFYHNFVRYNKLSKILGNALAFLSPHSWVETFGDSLIEAMACGTPVVAYKKGGPIEIIENGKSGFLVEPDNVDAMAKAVLKIKCLKRINARKRAEQFSYEKFVSRVENWISYALK